MDGLLCLNIWKVEWKASPSGTAIVIALTEERAKEVVRERLSWTNGMMLKARKMSNTTTKEMLVHWSSGSYYGGLTA